MILDDKKDGDAFLEEIVKNHVSGQMKIAPEHATDKVLNVMGKQGKSLLVNFRDKFNKLNKKLGKNQFLTYYFIAAHPGCNEQDMLELKNFTMKELNLNPEQVQVFTPTPSTYSTLMYYTEMNPFTNKKIFVEKDLKKKEKQKERLTIRKKLKK